MSVARCATAQTPEMTQMFAQCVRRYVSIILIGRLLQGHFAERLAVSLISHMSASLYVVLQQSKSSW